MTTGQVGHREPDQLPAAQPADGGRGVAGVPGAARQGQRLGLQLRARARHQVRLGTQQHGRLRHADQQVRNPAARGEHPGQALGRGLPVAEQPEVPRGVPERLGQPPEGQQPGVGVGTVGEPAEQHRQQRPLDRRPPGHPDGERLQVPQPGLRLVVAERRQPGHRRGLREPDPVRGQPGDRGEQRPVEQLLVQPADPGALAGHRALQSAHRVPAHPE